LNESGVVHHGKNWPSMTDMGHEVP